MRILNLNVTALIKQQTVTIVCNVIINALTAKKNHQIVPNANLIGSVNLTVYVHKGILRSTKRMLVKVGKDLNILLGCDPRCLTCIDKADNCQECTNDRTPITNKLNHLICPCLESFYEDDE
jgi:hypothetical protein